MTRKDKDSDAANPIKDSANQIWLAGLGAFAKAQEEGGKVFEALVKEGVALQRKTQTSAEEKLSEAAERMAGMANDLQQRATGQWGKLEGIFEERVAQALKRLGVPAARDVEALVARIDALEHTVAQLKTRVRPPAAKKAAPRKTPRATRPRQTD